MTTVKVETVGIVKGVLDIPAPISKSLAQGQYANVIVDSVAVLESFPDIAALISANKILLTEVDPPVTPPPSAVDVGDLNEVDSALGDLVAQTTLAVQKDITTLEQIFGSAMEGDGVLNTIAGGGDISAAELNAAAAGEFVKYALASLENSYGLVHGWANFAPVVTPAYTPIATGTGAAPTVYLGGLSTETEAPKFSSGSLPLKVIFDTDAGATKTYEVGDIVTVTVDVSALPNLTGVANLVITYNVIA